MPTMKSFSRFPVLLVLILFASCIRDVDVDQARDIIIPPTAALDLVYFTIDGSHFHEQGEGVLKATDQTRLEFLDDDYIRDGLVRADFNFQYTSTFSEEITSTIYFISEYGRVMYTIQFVVPAGTPESPNSINYTEIIKQDRIEAIRRSIEMRIELQMNPDSGNSEGELQLKSRGFYTFEFN